MAAPILETLPNSFGNYVVGCAGGIMNMMNTDVVYSIIAIVVPLVELLGILTAVHAAINCRKAICVTCK
jgi:hypothetical protein